MNRLLRMIRAQKQKQPMLVTMDININATNKQLEEISVRFNVPVGAMKLATVLGMHMVRSDEAFAAVERRPDARTLANAISPANIYKVLRSKSEPLFINARDNVGNNKTVESDLVFDEYMPAWTFSLQ
jgi:hypothetical protein